MYPPSFEECPICPTSDIHRVHAELYRFESTKRSNQELIWTRRLEDYNLRSAPVLSPPKILELYKRLLQHVSDELDRQAGPTAPTPSSISHQVAPPHMEQPRPKKSFWSGSAFLIPLAALVFSNYIARTLGILGVALLWGPLLLALWLSSWYAKRKNPSARLMTRLAWSNVVTWLFPPLGLFTATATLGLSSAPGASPRKYRVLGIVGLALTIINGLSGAYLAS